MRLQNNTHEMTHKKIKMKHSHYSKKLDPHGLVLVGSRNRLQRDTNTKLFVSQSD